MNIRLANPSDAETLLAIYAPYVENTAITFEYEVPTIEDFANRIEKTLEKYPYLVAEEDSLILGYAYASTYYARAAYDWAVELSVYVSQDARGKGVGSRLYRGFDRRCHDHARIAKTSCSTQYGCCSRRHSDWTILILV